MTRIKEVFPYSHKYMLDSAIGNVDATRGLAIGRHGLDKLTKVLGPYVTIEKHLEGMTVQQLAIFNQLMWTTFLIGVKHGLKQDPRAIKEIERIESKIEELSK